MYHIYLVRFGPPKPWLWGIGDDHVIATVEKRIL